MQTTYHEEQKQRAFDCYCKKVLRNEACSAYRERKRRREHEISLSELPEEAFLQLAVLDEYPIEKSCFLVCDAMIMVDDEALGTSLEMLPEEGRQILLMFWFLGMTDKEVAHHLQMAPSAVTYRRMKCYRRLAAMMREGNHDGSTES